jgi:hypothetical protein
LSGAKAACSLNENPAECARRVGFIRLSQTEVGIHSAESVLRLFDELVKCDKLKDVREAAEGKE